MLPRISSSEAREYRSVYVREVNAVDDRLVVVGDPPPTTAWARDLLERADRSILSWDGSRIDLTVDNGSWTWIAEAQSIDGQVVYARWPD